MGVVLSIDAGTTGVRSIAVNQDGTTSSFSYREFTQYFPKPGWVEHDPNEIWQAVVFTLNQVIDKIKEPVVAIGVTNQRETVLAWSQSTGKTYGNAIVWQDRRTSDRCGQLNELLPIIRNTTGLVLDPYFSATKIEWMLAHREIPVNNDLRISTIDSWLIWNLTGGKSFVTDPTNASRTMLFDIKKMCWSKELCELFRVPEKSLPEVRTSSEQVGKTTKHGLLPAGIPISGVAGDQQAALFGHGCFEPGTAKNTYGTGSFMLMNVGTDCPNPQKGLLTTVAWQLGSDKPVYALEGAIFVTGAAIQWLRDQLRIINSAEEVNALAKQVSDSGGVVVVPAFAGLGSPWWDPHARGAVFGISAGTNRAHLARATIESIAFQTRDVVEAMISASQVNISELRVDGGATASDLLLQLQADQLGVDVLRPQQQQATAIGAAFLAGLAVGFWSSTDEIAKTWKLDQRFSPSNPAVGYEEWQVAVKRSMNWAT